MCVHAFVCVFQVAMTRAEVCLRATHVSGVRHLCLVKATSDEVFDIDDQEAAYQDISGRTAWVSVCVCLHQLTFYI